MTLKNIKGIIFDYGGTIDTDGKHWSEVLWESYAFHHISVSKEQFREAYVHAERALAKHPYIKPKHTFYDLLKIKLEIELRFLLDNHSLTDEKILDQLDSLTQYAYDYARRCVLSARSVIDELAEQYPLVLVSNFYGNIETVLKEFGLFARFNQIIESAVVGIRKPDPGIFMLGVEALGFLPEETVVIGDSYKKDIIPAASLGCQTIWLKGIGWTDEEDIIEHNQIISNFVKIRDILL